MISNKFIKRNIFIKSINLIDNFFLNQNMIFYEDTLINYMLYKNSKSFYYLKDLGYCHKYVNRIDDFHYFKSRLYFIF